MIKTIFDETTGELLGAHLAGEGVTELNSGFRHRATENSPKPS
jgi:pyruvate/2-oxoglutarate dehydrogenase complex dihydrolipoamide dehydrogenase (E3) component